MAQPKSSRTWRTLSHSKLLIEPSNQSAIFWTQPLQRRRSDNDQHDKSNGDPDGAVANPTKDFEHDVAGLSGHRRSVTT